MNIYFIRHGNKNKEVTINQFGYPDQELSEMGIQESKVTGKHLSSIKFDAIYSSDLIRTKQTADLIAQYQEIKDIIIDERLREINMGIFHTSTEDEVKDLYPEFYKEYVNKEVDFTYLNGECGNDVRLRVSNFLSDVILKPYKNVAVVCHGGVIRSIFCYLLGMEQHKRFRINPSNCGISCIQYIEDFKVITINEILHLISNG